LVSYFVHVRGAWWRSGDPIDQSGGGASILIDHFGTVFDGGVVRDRGGAWIDRYVIAN
jgi:hypothetical protein